MSFVDCTICGGKVHTRRNICVKCGAKQAVSKKPIDNYETAENDLVIVPERVKAQPVRNAAKSSNSQRKKSQSLAMRLFKLLLKIVLGIIIFLVLLVGLMYATEDTKYPVSGILFNGWDRTAGHYLDIRSAKADIRNAMRDPSSAKFRNARRISPLILCIEANGKNGFGAYSGFKMYEYWPGIAFTDIEGKVWEAASTSKCFK